MSQSYALRTAEPPFEANGLLLGGRVYALDLTVANGQNLAAGAVVGIITATGHVTLSASASSDGSQLPVGVLAEAVNASGGARPGIVYLAGDFDQSRLTFGAGHTAASTRIGLAARGVFLFAPRA